MILLKNCNIYAPSPLGIKDILVGGKRILAIENSIDLPKIDTLEIIDAKGLTVIPGLIDAHVHIAGAGGEGGPSTRTPELQLSRLLEGGITTVVGCLGTDGMTRNIESVLMKVKSLRAEGVSAWMYTGAYQVPTPTLTGDVGRDIALIDEIIGVGEIAISDHRSSWPTKAELIRIAEHARVGGMLGGKVGIVNIHMGDAKDPFRPIIEAVESSELKYTQFLPTHCNRNDYIFEDAKTYGKNGYIDLTTSSYPYYPDEEIKPSKALVELLKVGVPIHHITFTSDANGSLPGFDEQGNLVKLEFGLPKSNLVEIRDAILNEGLPIEVAIQVSTLSPANILKLKRKGRIEVGADADILLLDKDLQITHLIALGEKMIHNGRILKKGTYE
jgi:beta-aspartyl-dipeptidase (metallo-type)